MLMRFAVLVYQSVTRTAEAVSVARRMEGLKKAI